MKKLKCVGFFFYDLNPQMLIKRAKLSMVFIPCCSFVLMNYNRNEYVEAEERSLHIFGVVACTGNLVETLNKITNGKTNF